MRADIGAPFRANAAQSLVAVALSALLVFGVFAAASAAANEAGNDYELSLAEAVQRALERAPEVTLARLAVAEAEIALQEAELGALVGRPRSEYEDAALALQQARDGFLDALVQVALEVEEAYYGVLRAAELLRIQESNQEQSDRQFALTKARYEAGLIARQDFLEAEASHADGRERLEGARRAHDEAMRHLALLVGLPADATLRLTEQFAVEPWSLPLDEAVAEALEQRAEVVRARRDVARAENRLEQASTPYAAPVEQLRAELQLERAQV